MSVSNRCLESHHQNGAHSAKTAEASADCCVQMSGETCLQQVLGLQ